MVAKYKNSNKKTSDKNRKKNLKIKKKYVQGVS